jgi:hypothetical protein
MFASAIASTWSLFLPDTRGAFPIPSHRQRVDRVDRSSARAQHRNQQPRGVSIATGIGSSALSPPQQQRGQLRDPSRLSLIAACDQRAVSRRPSAMS